MRMLQSTGSDRGANVTIFQAGTNDVRKNPLVSFFRTFERTKLYDLLAAMPLIAWYGFALSLQLPRLAHQIAALDLATADAPLLAGIASNLATQLFFAVLALLMILRRQPLGKASGFYPRFAAVAGTFMSLAIVMLPTRELSTPLHVVSTLLIVGGIGFALYAVIELGRSLYLGEAVALVGITLQYLSPWALALLLLQCIFQLERMKNEELVLSRVFPEYRDYAAHTVRLLPGVY